MSCVEPCVPVCHLPCAAPGVLRRDCHWLEDIEPVSPCDPTFFWLENHIYICNNCGQYLHRVNRVDCPQWRYQYII